MRCRMNEDFRYQERQKQGRLGGTGGGTMKGLSVHVKEDGVYLLFESSSGQTALVNAETIAEVRPPIAAEAIREWIDDQLKSKVHDA